MGFFDRFTKTLDDWAPRWEESGEALAGSWEAIKEWHKENQAVYQNLWNTAFGGRDEKENADAFWASKNLLDRTFDQFGRGGAAVGGLFGALGEQPVFRQAFALVDAAQRELVGRPYATGVLMSADSVNERNLGLVFDGDRWREAYNTTTYVTPGQAATYSGLSVLRPILPGATDEQRKRIIESDPELGVVLQDPRTYDPRDREGGRRAYYENTFMKGLSGTLDVGIVVAVDPTIIGAKVAGVAKLRYLSREMNAAALARGGLDAHVDSRSYSRAKDFIREAESSEQVRRQMFNNHYEGDLAAALLFDAAKTQRDYERVGGNIDLYDTTFRALYGDVSAWDTLTQEASRMADVIGHERANYTIANAARNYGTGDARVDSRVNDLVESKAEAWVDATVNGHGMWGKVAEAPLVGQTVPRITATSNWRTGFNSFVRNKVPTMTGHWVRRAQFILPSQRSGRMLDLNDPNAVGVFRNTLAMSRLDQRELDRWVGAYARASSSEARFRIYNAAENYAFYKHAQHYGLTPDELNDLVPVMNRFRRGNRQILANNRRYASEDVRKQYEKTLKKERVQSAQKLETLRHKIDKAVERGETPSHYYTLPDEHGMLTLVPEDLNLRLDKPITVTQHADTVPLVDWNVLENALWWHVGFGRGRPATRAGAPASWAATVGKSIYGAQDLTRAALEAALSVWKVTAIIRPGYVWRTLSDEIGRIFAVQKSHSSLSTIGRGSKNIAQNMWSRARIVGEIKNRKRARDQGDRIETEAEVVARGAVPDLPPEGRLAEDATFDPTDPISLEQGDRVYNSYERALADGILGVDDYLSRVVQQGRAGTLPNQLAEIYDAYRMGAKPEREFRRHAVDYAMMQAGRAAYVNPAWQRGLIRLAERSRQKKKAGEPGRIVAIDPLTGESPDLTRTQINKNIALESRHEIQRRPAVAPPLERVDPLSITEIAQIKNQVTKGLSVETAAPRILTEFEKRTLEEGINAGATAKTMRNTLHRQEPNPEIQPVAAAGQDITDFDVDDIYDFVADNLDELTKPDRVLTAYKSPHDTIILGVGRNMTPKTPIKRTGGVRVKLPFGEEGDLLRDSGTANIAVNTAAGRIVFRGGFLGGEGDRFRKQASNRGPEGAWTDAVTDIEFARFVEKSGRFVDIGPDDWRSYRTAWQRAVNTQLGQDKMAQQFLQGKSLSDVVAWLHNSEAGRAYQARMGPWRSQYAEQAAMVQSMVDVYLPARENRLTESIRLRERAMAGDATIEDLEAIVPRNEMPLVHGASLEFATGRGPLMDTMKRATDKTFKFLADLPNDKLARYPFAAERYNLHVKRVAEARGVQKARANQTFTESDLRTIEQTARNRALRDVQRYLFQTNATWDMAKSLRLLVPFGSSLADSFLKWGLVMRENPAAAINVWKLWNTPARAGLIQDEDGNQLVVEDGTEVWYQVNPETGEMTELPEHQPRDRFVSFRLPSWLSERFYGDDVQPMVRINKRAVQTFLDVPTAGPLIAVPASRFSLDNPEFAENRFVKQWILPLGPTSNESNIIIPANVRRLRQQFFPNWAEQDKQTAEAQAISIFASDMTTYSLGQRPNAPTFEEAREKAAAMRGLRFWAGFGGVSTQMQSPYQPYVDYYRQLRLLEDEQLRERARQQGLELEGQEVPSADELFYQEMGDEFFALTASVTRNALGIPATIEADNAYKKYQDLIEQHPDIASLIIGSEGAGEFSRAVYEAQKIRETRPGSGQAQRERLSLEESWEAVQERRGWLEYGKMQDLLHNDMIRLGVTSLQQVGAERLKAARDKWLEDRMFVESPWGDVVLNPWFQAFRSVDTSRMTERLHSMRRVVQDSRLQGRDDIRGLIEYLRLRDQYKGFMNRSGFGTLDSEQAAALRASWQRAVFLLKNDNLSFGSLYDRWLTADESLEAE